MERCLDWSGMIRRKQRKNFERFLTHPIERVRKLAHEIQAEDELLRRRADDDEDMFVTLDDGACSSDDVDDCSSLCVTDIESLGNEYEEDDIPF